MTIGCEAISEGRPGRAMIIPNTKILAKSNLKNYIQNLRGDNVEPRPSDFGGTGGPGDGIFQKSAAR